MPTVSFGRTNPATTRRSHGGIQVIARAANVLRSLEDKPDGLSLGQIAKRVSLARSTVQRIVGALGQIVEVLYADDICDRAALGDLAARDVAQSDMTHEALMLEFRKGGQRRLDRALRRLIRVEHDAKIDDIEHVELQVAQIVMHGLLQLVGGESRQPGGIRAPARADLGNDDEIVSIGM